MFEGKTITQIKPFGGLVAGDPRYYELWTQGCIVTIKNSKEVEAIEKTLKQTHKVGVDAREYLKYMIDDEDLFD